MNADRKDNKINKYADNLLVSYEILDYESKLSKIRTFSFSCLLWIALDQFSKKMDLC